jgi:branched-chain amino acid transport system ATP-binding protein
VTPGTPANGAEGLLAQGIAVHFGGLKALDGVDFELRRGELLGLIGPNGAGKTTLVNVLSGYQRPTEGAVTLAGEDVTAAKPHQLARRGVVRTFQSVRLFGGLSVQENVELGCLGIGVKRSEAFAEATGLLELMGLSDRATQLASALPHGDVRRLGLARALAGRPRFLLLDEPAAGLDQLESQEFLDMIRRARAARQCGVLVIEHDMSVIMGLSERIHVLDHGKTLVVGTPDEVVSNPLVLEAYLGPAAE